MRPIILSKWKNEFASKSVLKIIFEKYHISKIDYFSYHNLQKRTYLGRSKLICDSVYRAQQMSNSAAIIYPTTSLWLP